MKNRNIIFKMKKSKVTDYAALNIPLSKKFILVKISQSNAKRGIKYKISKQQS